MQANVVWCGVVWCAILVLSSCSLLSKDEQPVQTRAALSLDDFAKEALERILGLDPSKFTVLNVAEANYYHRDGAPVYSIKYCLIPCEAPETILIDRELAVLHEPALQEMEIGYVLQHDLKLTPSLIQMYQSNQGTSLPILISITGNTTPIDYFLWDENSIIDDEKLAEQRYKALERLRDETNNYALIAAKILGKAPGVVVGALTTTATLEQAQTLAAQPWVGQIENNDVRELVNLYSEHYVYDFREYEGTFPTLFPPVYLYAYGQGVGVLGWERGYPYVHGYLFPPGDPILNTYKGPLGDFVEEDIRGIAEAHAAQVFSVMSDFTQRWDLRPRGLSPMADFGWLASRSSGDAQLALCRTATLLSRTSPNTPFLDGICTSPISGPTPNDYPGAFGAPYQALNGSFADPIWDIDRRICGLAQNTDVTSWLTGFTFVFGDGNSERTQDTYLPDGGIDINKYAACPAHGYNSIAAGGAEDEKVALGSAYENAPSMHGDHIKPEISASFCYSVWDWNNPSGVGKCGTSFSAPIATSLAALLIERVPFMRARPDAIRALFAATARPIDNINGPSLGGGWGHLDGNRLERAIDPPGPLPKWWISRTLNASDFTASPMAHLADVTAVVSGELRIAIAWQTDRMDPYPANTPRADIDLIIKDDTGQIVASSTLHDSTIEGTRFTVEFGKTYHVYAWRKRLAQALLPISLAWYHEGDFITVVPTTLGAAASWP